MSVNSFKGHNHHSCVNDAIDALEAYCVDKKLKLTALRRKVFEILLEEHKAIKAYKILDRLRLTGMSAQPPVAYRSLEFLVSNGFAHKIERLNAFVACNHIGEQHVPAFLICRSCKLIEETVTTASIKGLKRSATNSNFLIENSVVEAIGTCPTCH